MSILPGEKAHAATQQFLGSIQTADRKKLKSSAAPVAATLHQRQGDRGSADDPDKLPVYVRFRDIRKAGIARNWPGLVRLVEQEGFPEGVWLGRNTRAWSLPAVLLWLEGRPSARKVVAPRTHKSAPLQDQA